MAALTHPRYTPLRPAGGPRRAGAIFAIALHAGVIAALLSYEPARSALMAAVPIMVELLSPPPPPAPQPKLEKPADLPKPKPVAKAPPKAVEPQPILTAPANAPSPVVAAQQSPAATSPAAADGSPANASGPPKAAAALTEPIFNADYLENPAPAYPALSRRSGEQGKVMLRVLVSTAGRAEDVQVRSSSGSPRLDEAARTTVLRWKFVPAKRGNEAVSAWVLIPISFRLEG